MSAEYDDEEYSEELRDNMIVTAYRTFRQDYKKNKKHYAIQFIISGILCAMISVYLLQIIRTTFQAQLKIYYDPVSFFYLLFRFCYITIPIALILFFFANVLLIQLRSVLHKGYEHNDRLNVDIADSGEGGSAHFMTEEEEQYFFHLGTDLKHFPYRILGIDAKDRYCAKKKVKYSNDNMAIVGSPGSGKSACIVFPALYQAIREGKSFVVTDSKGEIYQKSVYLARKADYHVKVLNLKPNEMKHSDAINLMTTIKDQMGAETMANIIMENTNEGRKKDFWYDGELNLLKALILWVRFSKEIPKEEKTLIKVYEMLMKFSPKQLEEKFNNLPPTSPAKDSASIYCNGTDTIKQSSHDGLGIRLNLLSQPAVKEILTHNEIDLRLPMTEKCAYYVVISDTDESAKFIACLFFSTLINELMDESDSRYSDNPPVDVEFILDEFRATGSIPGFDRVLSVSRSRHLNISFIVQDVTQLQLMYPDGWKTIMNNCTTWILLGAREMDTLKYFSDVIGDTTILSRGENYSEPRTDLLRIHNDRGVRTSLQKRKLMTETDIENMSDDELLVNIKGKCTIVLKKFNYWNHPFYHILEGTRYGEKHKHEQSTIDYMPKWRKKLIAQGKDVKDNFDDDEDTGSDSDVDVSPVSDLSVTPMRSVTQPKAAPGGKKKKKQLKTIDTDAFS